MLEHVAIWTENLEIMKDFYCSFFNAAAGKKYESDSEHHIGFQSYFLSFGDGSRLELMYMPDIPKRNHPDGYEMIGLTHIAFAVKTTDEVDSLTEKAHRSGYQVILEPHETGDGYYESCILDPDGNRVEITLML